MTTVVFLTSGTTWAVPGDWNATGATIECIGPGGDGYLGSGSSPYNGGGGQGGGYGKVTSPSNISIGNTLDIQIGAGGSTNPTFLKNNVGTIIVQGDYGASATSDVGATRSQTNTGATATYSGGAGGTGVQAGGRGGAGGAVINLNPPLKQPTANTALYCKNTTTGANVILSANGYKGK